MLDLYDGNLYKLALDGSQFEATLAPAGSLLVICGEEAEQANKVPPTLLGSGACFVSFAGKMPSASIESFDCELLEENVMLLNDFALELDGRQVYEARYVGHGILISTPRRRARRSRRHTRSIRSARSMAVSRRSRSPRTSIPSRSMAGR